MKIKKFAIFTLGLALLGAFESCKNPLTDFNLQISTQVIQHFATLKVVDASGNTIPGVQVALVSGDTENLYNLNGVKDFKMVDNLVTFGVDPKRTPTASTPIRFRVRFTAPGYTTQTVPVTISDVSSGIETVTLTQPIVIPDGAEQVQETVELSNTGATTVATSVEVPSAVAGEELVINIPAGTQFKDEDGNIITGGSVLVTVTTINPENESAVNLLPGGDLSSDAVVLANGSTVSGTFSPAAVTDIKMFVNGKAVESFSQPITVAMPIPSSYVSPITGQALAAGQQFDLFSNSDNDNIWKFEQKIAVTGSAAAGFFVNFPITHLTFYMAAEFGEACTGVQVVNFSGDWMANGTTYPVLVEAHWGDQIIFNTQYSISQNSPSISFDNVPKTGVKVVIKKADGSFLAEADLTDCGQVTTIQLPNPADVTGTTSTLQLYVRCPSNTTPITLLPTFQMYYRVVGSVEYKYLGTVDNGFLRTTLLKTDGTKYDFKAIWNDKVKVVNGHTVQLDNTATVGIGSGDIIGNKAGATNLAILAEECDKL